MTVLLCVVMRNIMENNEVLGEPVVIVALHCARHETSHQDTCRTSVAAAVPTTTTQGDATTDHIDTCAVDHGDSVRHTIRPWSRNNHNRDTHNTTHNNNTHNNQPRWSTCKSSPSLPPNLHRRWFHRPLRFEPTLRLTEMTKRPLLQQQQQYTTINHGARLSSLAAHTVQFASTQPIQFFRLDCRGHASTHAPPCIRFVSKPNAVFST